MRIKGGDIIEVMGTRELKENGLYEKVKSSGGRHAYMDVGDDPYKESNFFFVSGRPSRDTVRVLGDYSIDERALDIPRIAIKRVVNPYMLEVVSIKLKNSLTWPQKRRVKDLMLDTFLDKYQGTEMRAVIDSDFVVARTEEEYGKQYIPKLFCVPLFLIESIYAPDISSYDNTEIRGYLELYNKHVNDIG